MERWVLLHVHLRDDQRDRGRSSYVVQGMERLSTEFALWTGIEGDAAWLHACILPRGAGLPSPRAPVAQWIERRRPKAGVVGSIPAGGTMNGAWHDIG